MKFIVILYVGLGFVLFVAIHLSISNEGHTLNFDCALRDGKEPQAKLEIRIVGSPEPVNAK